MVLINGAGNTTVVVLVDTDLDKGLQVAQLQRQRVVHHDVRSITEGGRSQMLAFGVDDLGPLFPLGLGWRAIARFMLSGSGCPSVRPG